MKPLPLTAETQAILTRIRTHGWVLNVCGQSHGRAMRLVKARVERRIKRSGPAVHEFNAYRRYVHELVKSFRTETGEPLVKAIELTLRKWTNLGLVSALLQELLGECFLRFEQQGYAMPKTQSLCRQLKPRRRHGTYANSLKKGRAVLRKGSTVAEQAELQRQGSAIASAIARRLKPVLEARGITGRAFTPYYNFTQKLGRLSRNYGGKSLQIAASDLADLCEAKSLDPTTLRAIAHALFDINIPL